MIAPFGLSAPARILFGRGEARNAPDLAGQLGSRVFVVHGATPRHAAPLLAALDLPVTAFACPREPDLDLLSDALDVARRAGTDCVIAIGGGAAIDLGKAVAALLPSGSDPLDHLEVVGKGQPLAAPPLPFMAIPTTAGTGAEVTKNAVIGVPGHGRKVSLRDARMIADIALVDPALTDGTPKAVTLASGLDAVTQVIEPYISARANPVTDALCRDAIPRGMRALARLMREDDPAARDDMAFCSLIGGLALSNAGLGAVHGLAGVIGGRAPSAPHGAVCGALLPHVLTLNMAALGPDSPISRRIAEIRVSMSQAIGTVDLAGWSRRHGLPGLRQMGLEERMFPDIAADAQGASSMAANPVRLSDEMLVRALMASA